MAEPRWEQRIIGYPWSINVHVSRKFLQKDIGQMCLDNIVGIPRDYNFLSHQIPQIQMDTIGINTCDDVEDAIRALVNCLDLDDIILRPQSLLHDYISKVSQQLRRLHAGMERLYNEYELPRNRQYIPLAITIDVTEFVDWVNVSEVSARLMQVIMHRAQTQTERARSGFHLNSVQSWNASFQARRFNHAHQFEAIITCLFMMVGEHFNIGVTHNLSTRNTSADITVTSDGNVLNIDAKSGGSSLSTTQIAGGCCSAELIHANNPVPNTPVKLKGFSTTENLDDINRMQRRTDLKHPYTSNENHVNRVFIKLCSPTRAHYDKIRNNRREADLVQRDFIRRLNTYRQHQATLQRQRNNRIKRQRRQVVMSSDESDEASQTPLYKPILKKTASKTISKKRKIGFDVPIPTQNRKYSPLYSDPIWKPSTDKNNFSTPGHRLPLPAQTVPKSEGAKSNLFPSGQWRPPKRRRLNKKKFAKLENLYGMYAHGNYAPLKKRGFAYDNTKKDWSKPFKEDTQYAKNKRIMENLNIPTAFQNLNDEFQNVTPMKHQLKAKYTGDLEIPDYNEYIDHVAEAELEAELLKGVLDGSYSLNETGTIEGFDVKT
jgi:hypothetical protein